MKLISILLAMVMTARGASSDPAKVAIDFLEKVRVGKLDLEPGGDTALSPQTANEKKLEIAKRIERIARDLGNDPLEVGEVKLDENFGAVLVRKIGGFDPSRMQVFPIALVKRGTEWSAAPVPGSFENVGAGYAVALRKRLDLLENWMLREQVLDLEKLRDQSASSMRQKIQTSLPVGELRKFTAAEAGLRFLKACETKDLPAILGLLGGLSANLPDDWAARLKAANNATVSDTRSAGRWRLLTAPEVLRVPVADEEDDTSGLFSIACLDPSTNDTRTSLPRIEVVHFDLSKNQDGLWRIDPPDSFMVSPGEPTDASDGEADEELADEFPLKWRHAHPAPQQDSAAQTQEAFLTALHAPSLNSLLGLTKLDGEPAIARKACTMAARLWWTLHDPSSVQHAMPLAFQETENAAVGLFQFFSARDPDRSDLRPLYFEKAADGWHWAPDPAAVTREKFAEQLAPEIKRWSGEWQQSLLSDSVELEKIADHAAPDKEEAQKVVEEWLRATQSGDVKAALRLTARLHDPNGAAPVLRNLGHEIISARRNNVSTAVRGIDQGKIWTTVGVEVTHGGKSTFPLYPVIQTPQGPRILIEIDLFASRGREFLNKTALDRLGKLGSPTASEEMSSLLSAYQARIEVSKR